MESLFGDIVGRAFRGGVDISLRELVIALDLPEADVLGSCLVVGQKVAEFGLRLEPGVNRGDYDSRRALTAGLANDSLVEQVSRVLGEGEHSLLEFKSSMICDMRLYDAEPRQVVRNDGVTHSVLKTICAFSNSSGGRLIVGVSDAGVLRGVMADFELLGCDFDGWENHLRSKVLTAFRNGRIVNSFFSACLLNLDGHSLVVIDVVARSEPTFLKHQKEDRHEFYVRQGNRTTALDFPDFDEFRRGRFA